MNFVLFLFFWCVLAIDNSVLYWKSWLGRSMLAKKNPGRFVMDLAEKQNVFVVTLGSVELILLQVNTVS